MSGIAAASMVKNWRGEGIGDDASPEPMSLAPPPEEPQPATSPIARADSNATAKNLDGPIPIYVFPQYTSVRADRREKFINRPTYQYATTR